MHPHELQFVLPLLSFPPVFLSICLLWNSRSGISNKGYKLTQLP